MRVTTLNLRGLFDWTARLPRLVEYLRDVDADVVLLQEVVYLPDEQARTNDDLLNERLGYPFRHAAVTRLQAGREGRPYREGLSILSKHPVPVSEALSLLRDPADPHQRIVQFADVEAPDGVWPLGNVHLSVRDDFALTQLKELLAILAARGERRVLAGDFNVNRLEAHRALLRGWTASTSVTPYDSHPGTVETDDYVLAPSGIAMSHVQVSGDGLSDHRAVTVDLHRA